MEHPIAISVVIPSFNRREQVLRAVSSVLAQSHSPLEVIVVDDGSQDGTAEAVETAAWGPVPVRCLRMLSNGGACVARNAGAGIAEGDWVAFLDSDDSWHPDKLARQAEALAGAPTAVAAFTGMLMERPGGSYVHLPPGGLIRFEGVAEENVLGSTSTALVSKAAFEAAGRFDPAMPACQDWDLWLRLLRHGVGVAVAEPLTVYSDGEHERISRSVSKVIAGHRIAFSRIQSQVSAVGARRRLRASHAMRLAEIMSYQGGMHVRALWHCARALATPGQMFPLKGRSLALLRFIAWRAARRPWRLAASLVPRLAGGPAAS